MTFNKAEGKLVFLNIASYASSGDQENNEWGGRLKIITQTLDQKLGKINEKLDRTISEIKSETAVTIKSETAAIKAEIKNEIKKQNSEIKDQLTKMMDLLSKTDQKKETDAPDMGSLKLTLKVKQVKKN